MMRGITVGKDCEIINLINKDDVAIISLLSTSFPESLLSSLNTLSTSIIEYIISKSAINIITLLFKTFPQVSKVSLNPNSPNILYTSFQYSNCNFIKLIISYFDESIYKINSIGENELDYWAKYHQCESCLKYIVNSCHNYLQYFTQENIEGMNIFERIANLKNEATLLLISKYFNIDYTHKDNKGEGLIHKIARNNLIKALELLPMKDMILNAVNIKGDSPLTIALNNGNFIIAENLIEKGVAISIEDYNNANKINNIPLSLSQKLKQETYQRTKKDIKTNSLNKSLVNSNIKFTELIKNNNNYERNQSYFISPRKKKNNNSSKGKNKTSEGIIKYSSKRSHNSHHISNEFSSKLLSEVNSLYPSNIRRNRKSQSKKLQEFININKSNISNQKCNISQSSTPLKKNRYLSNEPVLYSKYVYKEPSPKVSNFPKILNKENIQNNRTSSFFPISSHLTLISSFSLIPFNDIHFDSNKPLYCSDISTVYKGTYLHLPISVKCYSHISSLSKTDQQYLINEISLSLSLHHPNIVTFIGVAENDDDIYLLSEYMENKGLNILLENTSVQISINEKIRIAYEIALGVYYLHTRTPKVFHRDLKSSNILIDKNYTAKICDFGMSKYKKDNQYKTNSQSTPFWMAPEYITNGIFTEKSDVYSFGILLWEIFMRDTNPYRNENINDFILGNEEVIRKRPFIDIKKISECKEVKGLIEDCWDYENENRPYMKEVIQRLSEIKRQLIF